MEEGERKGVMEEEEEHILDQTRMGLGESLDQQDSENVT